MPQTVEIPLQVTVDAAALTPGGAGDQHAASAVRAATGRAIAAGLRETAPEGGETPQPVLTLPEITWSGDFSAVDPAARERMERAVGLGHAAAAADAGLGVATATATAEPAAPVAPPPPAVPAAPGFAQPPAGWNDDDFAAALLRVHVRTGTQPAGGVIGLIYADGAQRHGITVFDVAPDWSRVLVLETARRLRFYDVTVDAGGTVTHTDAGLATSGPVELQILRGTPAALRELRIERLRRTIARQLPDRPAAQRRALADAVAQLDPGGADRALAEFTAGGSSYLTPGEAWVDSVPPGLVVPVLGLLGADLGAVSTGPPRLLPLTRPPVEPATCEPYDHEPAVGDLGAGGELLRRDIARLAHLLGISECAYAGRFALNAAARLAGGARAIGEAPIGDGDLPMPLAYTAAPGGNAGAVDFTAAATPPILELQRHAAVFPHVSALWRDIARVYRGPDAAEPPPGRQLWLERFEPVLAKAERIAAEAVFASACREVLLQLLHRSQVAIDERLLHVEGLAVVFDALLLAPLDEIDELQRLRDALRVDANLEALENSMLGRAQPQAPGAPEAAWAASRDNLAAIARALEDGRPSRDHRGDVVQVEIGDDGRPRARDSRGRAWTMQELEQAIPLRRAIADEVDPLVQQVTDLSGFLDDARRSGTEAALRSLLDTMADDNHTQRLTTAGTWLHGFRAGRLAGGLPGVTYADVALLGIHLQAHNLVEPAFAGDRAYPDGLRALFGGEAQREELSGYATTLLIMSGSIALAMACPPAGPIIGIMASAAGLQIALHRVEQEQSLYRALIDPGLVIGALQIEQERYDAWVGFWLGAALSFIPGPELDTLLRDAGRLAGAVAISDEIVEYLASNLIVHEVYDEVADQVIELMAQAASAPVVEQLRHDLEVDAP